jgi:hypothetical protein
MLVSSRLNQIESPRQLGLRKRNKKSFQFFIIFWWLLLLLFLPHHTQMVFSFLAFNFTAWRQNKGRKIVLLPHWIVRDTKNGRWGKETEEKSKITDERHGQWLMKNLMRQWHEFSLSHVRLCLFFYFISWHCRMSNSFLYILYIFFFICTKRNT